MKIVIDTNVLISGIFFGGFPRAVIESVVEKIVEACASVEMIAEYEEIVKRMLSKKQGHFSGDILSPFIQSLNIIVPNTKVDICRDPDDNKFIECAIDSGAVYIVSGDMDLLVLEKFKSIEILTATEFVEKHLDAKDISTL